MAVGKRLKEKREELGLSIEDIEENIKIRKKYIIALENDNYEEIPGLVYARAFLKNYSSFLGLDAEEILEEFDRWRHLEDVDAELEGSRRRLKRSRQDSDEGIISRFFSFSPRVLLAAFILVLIAGGVTYNLVIMNGNGDMEAEPDDIPAVVEEEEEPAEAPEEEAEDIEEVDEETEDLTLEDELVMQELEQYQIDLEDDFNGDMSEVELENGFDEEIEEFDYEAISEPEDGEIDLEEDEELEELVEDPDADEVPDDEPETIDDDDDEAAETETDEEPEEIPSEVEIIITERAWLRISVDGENVFEGTLEAGEEQIYEPENSFEIRTGNAGGVELTVAGEEMGTIGETGEVVEEEFEL